MLNTVIYHLEDIAAAHHVDPFIFVLIYVVSTPPFLIVSGWLFHHIRRRRRLEALVFLWALLYTAPYIYVLIAGRNLAVWIYLLIAAMILSGLALAACGFRRRLARDRE